MPFQLAAAANRLIRIEAAMITVTPGAAEKLKNMLERAGFISAEAGIRFGVKAGGCSGFEYFLKPISRPDKFDEIIEMHGIKVFVDPRSMVLVKGTEIDASPNLIDPFIFKNPNAKSSCGCGTSFEV